MNYQFRIPESKEIIIGLKLSYYHQKIRFFPHTSLSAASETQKGNDLSLGLALAFQM
jgi:hypothetical protein